MANTGSKEHRCRGMTKQSQYTERCTQTISPDKYDQGIRYCKPHIDQEGENDETSFTDSEDEEVLSGRTTPQAPFLYIGGNSKQSIDNSQIAHDRPQTYSTPTQDPKQDASSSGRQKRRVHDRTERRVHNRTEEQQALNIQRTAQSKRSHNSPSNPLVERRKPFAEQAPRSPNIDQFQQSSQSRSFRPFESHSERRRAYPELTNQQAAQGQYHRNITRFPPSQFKRSSEPLYSDRKQQTDFTHDSWSRSNPSGTLISSDDTRPRPPPLFHQPQIPSTSFVNATSPLPARASSVNTQSRPRQQEKSPQSQAQTQNRVASVDRWAQPDPAIGQPNRAQISDPLEKAIFIGEGRRQSRVSAAGIQRQYATVCESWQHFSREVNDLISMIQSE